jgi:hypothetical protein
MNVLLETSVIVSFMYSVAVVVVNRNMTVIRIVTIGTGNIVISTNDDDVNEKMNTL